jgi:hypothetical protein
VIAKIQPEILRRNGVTRTKILVRDARTDAIVFSDVLDVEDAFKREIAARRIAERTGDDAATLDREILQLIDAAAKLEAEQDAGPEPMLAGDFMLTHSTSRPMVLDGIARRRDVVNVIASPKSGKSWLVLDLLLCICADRLWLGRFRTQPGRVLLIDNELHPDSIARRLPLVAEARGIALEEYAGQLAIVSLRGHHVDLYGIERYLARYEPGHFSAVVVDALYRTLPDGTSEADNAQMMALYNLLARYTLRYDCTAFVVHHSSKGEQGDKAATDVGSGAGSISRAADAHLIIRPHEEDSCYVLEGVNRDFKPPEPVALRWEFPVFTADETLDPAKLRKGRRKKAENEPEAVIPWTTETFVRAHLSDAPRTKDEVLVGAALEGISNRKAQQLLNAAEAKKLVHRWTYGPRRPIEFATIPQPKNPTARAGGGGN